jgi:ABC-type transporter Mla MlaB component
MIRVTIHPADDGMTMKIEGKIAGRAVSVLHQAWQDLAPSLAQGKLLLDLRGVTHVDGTGSNLLADIHDATGAEFVADTPLTKYYAEKAQEPVRRTSDLNAMLRRQS